MTVVCAETWESCRIDNSCIWCIKTPRVVFGRDWLKLEETSMTTIHDLIERVKEREAAAAQLVVDTRLEAARIVAEAGAEGRTAHDRLLVTAREEGERLLAAAREESRRESARLAGETGKTLAAVDDQAGRRLDEAVAWLLDIFQAAHPSEGG